MNQKYTPAVVKRIVEDDTNHEYSLLFIDEKGSAKKKREMTIKHNKCGREYNVIIYDFIDGSRCPQCKGEALRKYFAKSIDTIKKETQDITNGEYSFVDSEYVNSKTPHKFQHNTCGKIFEKKWDKFRVGQQCPQCYKRGMDSRTHHYLKDIFDHFKIVYELEKKYQGCKNPKTNKHLLFDFYLSTINLLIEVDGEHHDRACYDLKSFKDTKYRDNIKNEYVRNNNIGLLRIPVKDWTSIHDIIAPIVSEVLGRKVDAEEITKVKQSNIPDRIGKDLQKYHNGEYALADNFFLGVDTKHNFQHLKCNTTFKSTLYSVKKNKYPCPVCREEAIARDNFIKRNKFVEERTNGKYSLSEKYIVRDKDNKGFVKCNACKHEWWCHIGNILTGNGGCPNCLKIKRIKQWREKYYQVIEIESTHGKLPRSLKHWKWKNNDQFKEGKLEAYKIRLLKRANCGLL